MGFAPPRWLISGAVGLLVTMNGVCMAAPSKPVPTPATTRPAAHDETPAEPVGMPAAPGRVDLSHGVVISLPDGSSASAIRAAEYLRAELIRRFEIAVIIDDTPALPSDQRAHVILVDAGGSDTTQIDASDLPSPGLDGYHLRVSAKDRRAIVASGGGNGVIRGAFALAELVSNPSGAPAWPEVNLCDTPELKIRMTREIFSGHQPPLNMSREQIARCQLDWWARWGLNHTFLPSLVAKSLPEQEEYAKWYVRECRERGMKVGVNLGGRSLCASDPEETAAYLELARRLLASGCDFLSVLFDDLPSTRTAGHCDRCVKKFGGSLAREQRYIIESLEKVLETFGPDRKLIWCPTYYSLGMTGYLGAAEGPEAYFSILGDSPAVRKAWMYHCAFDGAFNGYLDSKGLKRRIWWYNGIRTQYYMVSRDFDGYETWGERLTIPGVQDFHSFFSPFENGWLMPGFRSADSSQHPCVSPLATASRDADGRTVIPPESWAELRQLAQRMDGMYFCGSTTPYHIGLSGVFAAHPSSFDPKQAARLVMTAMFGPEGEGFAARWEEAYSDVQMKLARAKGRPLTGGSRQKVEELTAAMSALELQLRDCVSRDSLALPRAVLDPLLDDMSLWRKKAWAYATQSPGPADTLPDDQEGKHVP